MEPPQETTTEIPGETLPELQASPLWRVEAIQLIQELVLISLSATQSLGAPGGMPLMVATPGN